MRARQIRRQIRRAFFGALFHQIQIISPILWGIILVMVIIGLLIGRIEGWTIGDALYFTFVTGLTIGYGDLTPRHIVSRCLAVVIGFSVMPEVVAGRTPICPHRGGSVLF